MSIFGFTNDKAEYDAVVQFRAAAVADGWTSESTYLGHESVERASKHSKDGFHMMILTRSAENGRKPGKWDYEAAVNIWGPDRLVIEPPLTYDFAAIQRGLRKCSWCGKEDVETQRVAFTNRICQECLSAAREKLEYSGWCN